MTNPRVGITNLSFLGGFDAKQALRLVVCMNKRLNDASQGLQQIASRTVACDGDEI
jgi:hypothetical protein